MLSTSVISALEEFDNSPKQKLMNEQYEFVKTENNDDIITSTELPHDSNDSSASQDFEDSREMVPKEEKPDDEQMSNISDIPDEFDASESDHSTAQSVKKKNYKCTFPNCEATFTRPSKLLTHKRSHTGERPFQCTHPGCEKAYTNSSHLRRHIKVNHTLGEKETFTCDLCSLVMSTAFNLKRHNDRVHKKLNKFCCQICDAAFYKKQQLLKHEGLHMTDNLYKCEKCDKGFTTEYRLRRHMKSHEKKTYPCKVEGCTEILEKWTQFRTHMKIKHPTDHKCGECDKSFPSRSQLRAHSAVHPESAKLIPCPYEKCHRSYHHKRNLNHHIRANHLGKKFYCDICNLGLSNKDRLAGHIKTIHELKKKKQVHKTSARRKRKDADTVKSSMITKLIGLNLPPAMDKAILYRKPRIEVSSDFVENNLHSD